MNKHQLLCTSQELEAAKEKAADAVVQLEKAEVEKENAFAKLKGEGPESERKTQMINLLEYEVCNFVRR